MVQPSASLWLSEEEKVRVAFKRAKSAAAKMGLDRSPFFPRTAAEYAGLKAEMLEDKADRLRTRIREMEGRPKAKETRQRQAVALLESSGQIEEEQIRAHQPRSNVQDSSAEKTIAW